MNNLNIEQSKIILMEISHNLVADIISIIKIIMMIEY